MELADQLLGQPYHVGGTIVHGRHLGSSLGMPTVNIVPPEQKLLPPNGVYFSYIKMNGNTYQGITNIGTKPTVSGEAVMGVETYIYDFSRDVYGQEAEVYLLHYKRPEMRFDGIEALKAQMATDIAKGREYHGLA